MNRRATGSKLNIVACFITQDFSVFIEDLTCCGSKGFFVNQKSTKAPASLLDISLPQRLVPSHPYFHFNFGFCRSSGPNCRRWHAAKPSSIKNSDKHKLKHQIAPSPRNQHFHISSRLYRCFLVRQSAGHAVWSSVARYPQPLGNLIDGKVDVQSHSALP